MHSREISVYGRFPEIDIPPEYGRSYLSEATSSIGGRKGFIGNDILLWYRTVDVIDSILGVCAELDLKKHPMTTKYVTEARVILERGEEAEDALKRANMCRRLLLEDFCLIKDAFCLQPVGTNQALAQMVIKRAMTLG